MSPDLLFILLAAVLGALIGSFSNVLIHRLPRRESIAFPPSRCPGCQHRLGVLDLVPVLSWAGLRGRCHYCEAPISARYPLVELLTAGGYALLAYLFPLSQIGPSLLGLFALFTLLLVIAFIDAETRTIPDELVLPGVALGIGLGALNSRFGGVGAGLPAFGAAFGGALLGSGVVALIALFGELALRRGRERRFPEFPVNYQQVALAAFAGAWFGAAWGVALGLLSVALSVFARRTVRVPELLTLGGLVASIVLSVGGTFPAVPSVITLVPNAVAAAGGMSLLAGLYWWTQPDVDSASDDSDSDAFDPVAMGFGDVKLAALMGAFMGFLGFAVSLGVAVVVGAVFGVLALAVRRDNKIPFGPYLAVGAFVSLVYGPQLIRFVEGFINQRY